MNDIQINEAHETYTHIVELRKAINTNFWTLVASLKKAHEERHWALLGHESWASYLAQPEIDLNASTVKNYIYIYNNISKCINKSNMYDKLIPFDIDIGKLMIVAPKINEDNAEELLDKARHLSRSDLRKEVVAQLPSPELPKDKYNIIYADPPWKYDNEGISGAAERHYATMETKDICNLQIPSSLDSVLFLWVTNPFLKEGLQVCEAWGFQYKTNMVWVKERAGQGFYVKGQHELLFIATKGNMRPKDNTYVRSVIKHDRLKHSQKPEKFYNIIEELYPNGKYLELFARKNDRPKWTTWGNEAI